MGSLGHDNTSFWFGPDGISRSNPKPETCVVLAKKSLMGSLGHDNTSFWFGPDGIVDQTQEVKEGSKRGSKRGSKMT
jgi:hypothetical protein